MDRPAYFNRSATLLAAVAVAIAALALPGPALAGPTTLSGKSKLSSGDQVRWHWQLKGKRMRGQKFFCQRMWMDLKRTGDGEFDRGYPGEYSCDLLRKGSEFMNNGGIYVDSYYIVGTPPINPIFDIAGALTRGSIDQIKFVRKNGKRGKIKSSSRHRTRLFGKTYWMWGPVRSETTSTSSPQPRVFRGYKRKCKSGKKRSCHLKQVTRKVGVK